METPGQEEAEPQPVFYRTLQDAVEGGDLERVTVLLDAGMDVDGKSSRSKKSLLLVAAEKGNAELLDLLIERGADVNYGPPRMMSPLHRTVRQGKVELFHRLVEAGADISQKGPGGWRPLHYAARYGRTEIATFLVESGCDINAKTSKRETALHLAFELELPHIAEHIVDLGANVRGADKEGVSPFEKACAMRSLSLVEKIFSRIPSERRNYRRILLNRGLYRAFIQDYVDLERFLVDQGANLNIRVNERYSLLHYASECGFEDSVGFLLEKGADVHAVTDFARWTPLHFAGRNGHAGVVRILCEHGADPNVLDGMQRTPMHLAARADDLESVRELTERGADTRVQDLDGNTPLHYAAERGRNRLIRFLVQRAADLEVKNSTGHTALDVAMASERSNAVDFLVSTLAKKEIQDASAYSREVAKVVRASLTDADGKIQPDKMVTQLRRGDRPLHVAVREGSFPAVRTILEADGPEARNSYGYLALHLAADRGDIELVALLIRYGASAGDQGNPAKWSPLHFAASKGHIAVAKALLRAGADAKASDGMGLTPLQLAGDQGMSEVMPLLREAAALR